MAKIIRFEITGLFGYLNVNVPVKSNRLILVGPNGAGKSTIINLFYFMYTKQFFRMNEYDFESAKISFYGKGTVEIFSRDLARIHAHRRRNRPRGAVDRVARQILGTQLATQIQNTQRISDSHVNKISIDFRVPRQIAHRVASLVQTKPSLPFYEDEDDMEYVEAQTRFTVARERLSELVTNMTFYLPTYRRIERELSTIFPEIESRIHGSYDEDLTPRVHSDHYAELVSFGMEDVDKIIATSLDKIKDYARGQLNNLAGSYLRDVIRKDATKPKQQRFSKLTEARIDDVLRRVDENILDDNDKTRIKKNIIDVQKSNQPQPADAYQNYLAHYFGMLVDIDGDIKKQERHISAFATIADNYLGSNKTIRFDETNYKVILEVEEQKPINLIDLSSGEKQIVSIFAHLYLGENAPYSVIIDEPELSLSVPWQEKFLPDIWKSGQCELLLAVTHSPFIYKNEFEEYAVDVRRVTKPMKK